MLLHSGYHPFSVMEVKHRSLRIVLALGDQSGRIMTTRARVDHVAGDH